MSIREPILTGQQVQALVEWKVWLESPEAVDWASKSESALRHIHAFLYSKQFVDGKDLTEAQLRETFSAMRELVWNMALGALIRTARQRRQFNHELRALCHSQRPLVERIERFVQLPGVGPLTLSHFLCVIDPEQFPLISP